VPKSDQVPPKTPGKHLGNFWKTSEISLENLSGHPVILKFGSKW